MKRVESTDKAGVLHSVKAKGGPQQPLHRLAEEDQARGANIARGWTPDGWKALQVLKWLSSAIIQANYRLSFRVCTLSEDRRHDEWLTVKMCSFKWYFTCLHFAYLQDAAAIVTGVSSTAETSE